MKTLLLTALAVLVASCRIDKLLSHPGDSPPPSASQSMRLVFTVEPGKATAGEAIAPGVRVTAQDQGGSTATSFQDAITLTLGTNPAGGTLSGRTMVPAVNGVAMFSDLSIDRAASGYVLTAAADSVNAATSGPFDVVPGPAVQLVFSTQPSHATPGSSIRPPVQVTAFDAKGNRATTFSGVVTVAIGHDGSALQNARLSGSTASPVSDGVATFTDLSIDQIGNGYTLTAAFGTGPAVVVSAAFSIGIP